MIQKWYNPLVQVDMNSSLIFGEWLRQRRDELGFSRKEFARLNGCSISMLRKIEDGQRKPSAQLANLIANCLNINQQDRPAFIKVARGELGVDRLSSDLSSSILKNPFRPKINLPIAATPLLGRRREIEELCLLLRNPLCRLLSLVGPGGVGKTRLAIEIALREQISFPDGAFFIPLAPINSTRVIVPAIAEAIGFSFIGSRLNDPKVQLLDFLREKQTLLLMDNLEHLLQEPGIEVIAEILASAPRVKVITTSRESLGLQGEWIFNVHGLSIPKIGFSEESIGGTSIELFLQSAQRAYISFHATPDDFPDIAHICKLVDGIPLGIEMAASWVRILNCREIAHEIEQGPDFLRIVGRDLPVRHHSMKAVFEHSWKLLTEQEQQILLRLSIFRGGFTLDAAKQVAQATLSILTALVSKSLVQPTGNGRYDLHELIRQFSAERLAECAEIQMATQACHANYYLTRFSQANKHLRSPAQHVVLLELAADIDNIRVAWEWTVNHYDLSLIDLALGPIAALFYDTGDWWQEGLDFLGQAIDKFESAPNDTIPNRNKQIILGRLLAYRAMVAARMSNYEQARSMLERSLSILRPLNSPESLVETITYLGKVMERCGNYSEALVLFEEGEKIAITIGDRWFATLCRANLTTLAGITQIAFTPEITLEKLRTIVAEWRSLGDPRMTAITLNDISCNASMAGMYDEARAALEESATLAESIGDHWEMGFVYRSLAILEQTKGNHDRAIKLFRKSLETLKTLGARQDVARILSEMSKSMIALGEDNEVIPLLNESLRLAYETQGISIELDALVGISYLQARQGDKKQALELLLRVLCHPALILETRERAVHLQSELESELTDKQVKMIQACMGEKTVDRVVEEILLQAEHNL